MTNLKRFLWIGLLSTTVILGCAGWEVKTPSDQPISTEEQQTPQGKTSIGGELGKEGRGADRQ